METTDQYKLNVFKKYSVKTLSIQFIAKVCDTNISNYDTTVKNCNILTCFQTGARSISHIYRDFLLVEKNKEE